MNPPTTQVDWLAKGQKGQDGLTARQRAVIFTVFSPALLVIFLIIGAGSAPPTKTTTAMSDNGEPTTVGVAIRFDNALIFDLGQATLRPEVRADLADLASSLRNYPGHDVVIVGHSSTDGPSDFNHVLSENRAWAVYDFLVSQGVSPEGLEAYGLGESEPLAGIPGTSPENRRVEIGIVPMYDEWQM